MSCSESESNAPLDLVIRATDSTTINTALFARGDTYEIPLYQRAYAWGEDNVVQLIEDIAGIADDGSQNYYLGTLVVYPKDGVGGEGYHSFEVIDGQQRLTTLYLLPFALGDDPCQGDDPSRHDGQLPLSFACRDKSNYTLKHLGQIEALEADRIEPSIERNLQVIRQKLSVDFSSEDELESFKKKLSRTHLYRIEVPPHTDLNHYFEIMNTRGEQLEQHEVLKARLMKGLPDKERAMFSTIWDACSDMSRYIQMSFGTCRKRQSLGHREQLFKSEWNAFPSSKRIEEVAWEKSVRQTAGNPSTGMDIRSIIHSDFLSSDGEAEQDRDEESRFESIIDFRFFLLHALKVFVDTRGIVGRDSSQDPLVPELLDDKKLIATFEQVIDNGAWNGRAIDPQEFATEFAKCLLQTRFLFDKCIIKREYAGNGGDDGQWSLKELHRNGKSWHGGKTKFGRRRQDTETQNKEILMLQSCLRVSYTSPKVMHWITRLLCELMRKPDPSELHDFRDAVESCAKDAVRDFLEKGDFAQGVNTPHVVLNYLDFLLWRKDRDKNEGGGKDDYSSFVFEFRNSVEHWYPRNPSDDTFERWDNADNGVATDVDRFGNLCLVQRNVNSKFSNLAPVAKKSTFKGLIDKGSLKLREMAQATRTNEDWRDRACEEHEEEMIELLKEACGFPGD